MQGVRPQVVVRFDSPFHECITPIKNQKSFKAYFNKHIGNIRFDDRPIHATSKDQLSSDQGYRTAVNIESGHSYPIDDINFISYSTVTINCNPLSHYTRDSSHDSSPFEDSLIDPIKPHPRERTFRYHAVSDLKRIVCSILGHPDHWNNNRREATLLYSPASFLIPSPIGENVHKSFV